MAVAPINILLPKLEHVRQTGPDSWRAACPAHGQHKRQTLAVRELPDRRVLVHCFADCNPADIVAAIGLDLSDLFPPQTLPVHPHRRERFNPADVLRGVALELTVATATMRAVRNGQTLDAQAWARFDLALTRLVAAEGMANGQ